MVKRKRYTEASTLIAQMKALEKKQRKSRVKKDPAVAEEGAETKKSRANKEKEAQKEEEDEKENRKKE